MRCPPNVPGGHFVCPFAVGPENGPNIVTPCHDIFTIILTSARKYGIIQAPKYCEVNIMAKAMSQVPVGTMIWVVYNEYRGGPYIYNYYRVSAACRTEIEPTRSGNRQYKIEYMFEMVPKSVPPERLCLSEDEAKALANKLNAKRKH